MNDDDSRKNRDHDDDGLPIVDPVELAEKMAARYEQQQAWLNGGPSPREQESQPAQQHPSDAFDLAAQAATDTPQGTRERDVADVIREFAATTGFDLRPEHAQFMQAQEALGERITVEPDPIVRQELRNEREAQAHEYAGSLFDRSARVLGLMGDPEGAAADALHAGLRREIAAELRGGNQPEHDPEAARVAFAAAAVEASGLGRTAHAEFVVDGPTGTPSQPDYGDLRVATAALTEMQAAWAEDEPVALAANRAEIGAFMGTGPGGTFIYTGQTHSRDTATDYEGGPTRIVSGQVVSAWEGEPHEAAATMRDAVDAYQRSDESAKEQTAVTAARNGTGREDWSGTSGEVTERRAAILAKMAEEMVEGDGGRENFRETAATAFRSFGGRGMA